MDQLENPTKVCKCLCNHSEPWSQFKCIDPGHPKKKILFPVQRVSLIEASSAAAFFFVFFFLGGGGLVGKYFPFFKEKKVPIRTLFNHPAATPETEFFFLVRPHYVTANGVRNGLSPPSLTMFSGQISRSCLGGTLGGGSWSRRLGTFTKRTSVSSS